MRHNIHHGGGSIRNRQCSTCTPPCQGGEVLHRRGYCSHRYCLCVDFTPEQAPSLLAALMVGAKANPAHLKPHRRGMGAGPQG